MELTGGVALVTGAAHRLGKAIAIGLASAGMDIVIHYGGSKAEAETTAIEIERLGVGAVALQADLSHARDIERLLREVARRHGRLDVLVNSAATFQPVKFDAVTVGDWDRVMAVNLRAPFLLLQGARELLVASARRRDDTPALAVNIADLSGVLAWRGFAPHAVSKAGLLHLTRVAARELAPEVRVNAIVPGAILPPPDMPPDGEAWRRIGAAGLLGRSGDPSQVADTVRFLAANDFVTGAVIHVDGGESLVGPWRH